MKVIISHDVDHLFGRDHWLRDFIYPKLWVRTILQVYKGEITRREAVGRIMSCWKKERHHIAELMCFDKEFGVPSSFFFGMNQGLGMSYYPEEAQSIIQLVYNQGFEVGVHGIIYDDYEGIKKERDTFKRLMGFDARGIRMHYVRFNEDTFGYESDVGYLFDSTEFDKQLNGTIKNPYKVKSMWEFPLSIMDGYLPQNCEAAKKETIKILNKCHNEGLKYVCILFHDYLFDDAYQDMKQWYMWLINTLHTSDAYEFISYIDAVNELERNSD